MRIMKIKGFIAPMDLNTGSCEDSMAINLTNGRFAVADGVTNSVHPEIVSSLLCNHFVKGDIILSDWPVVFENKLLPSISEEWKSKEEILFSNLDEFSKDLAEIKRKRKGPGASTFAGIEVDKVNNKVSYLILGDCTLFFIKEDGSYFAINSGQESHEKGDLLNFNNTPNCIVVGGLGQPQRIHGEWLTGSFKIESGYILLMTDGCAEWFQGAYAKDSNVLENLWNLPNNDTFAQLADQERTLNGKMDDDLAVIMLKIDSDIFQMDYFPTGQSQTMLINKTGSVVTDNVDNNNVNLGNEEYENNEEKEIEVTTDVNESEVGNELENEDEKDAEGKEYVKENNIDESKNDDIENTDSINHNDAEIKQEPEDDLNTLTESPRSEDIETNIGTTLQDKSTRETSDHNETVMDVNPKEDDLKENETQNLSENTAENNNRVAIVSNENNQETLLQRIKDISSSALLQKSNKCPYCGESHLENSNFCPTTGKRIIFCPFCGGIHHEGIVYCPNTGKTMPNLAQRWLNKDKKSGTKTHVLPNIICRVCGTQYDTDTCPNCGQPHPGSIQTKVNVEDVIQNQEKKDEEDLISDSTHENQEDAQIDINVSDGDNCLPPSNPTDEQIVDVNVNIETVDSLTKNDSSVPVVQQSDTETLVEETSSKDEFSQTPTENFLEEIDVNASESLPEASLIGNPVGDNDNSHNINKS